MESASSLLTQIIGGATLLNLIVVTVIAIQQFLLRKENLEYNIHKDLYDRRLEVFQETTEMLRIIVNSEKPDWKELIEVLRQIEDDAYFLFDDEIHSYIHELISKGNKKRHLNKKVERLNRSNNPDVEDERIETIDKVGELTEWFQNQFKVSRNKFNKYLSYESYLK